MHRIRELREEKGLTQVRLAVAADMNPATLNRIEMGKANPNLKTLERLAGALDITVSRLLEDDSPKAAPSLFDALVEHSRHIQDERRVVRGEFYSHAKALTDSQLRQLADSLGKDLSKGRPEKRLDRLDLWTDPRGQYEEVAARIWTINAMLQVRAGTASERERGAIATFTGEKKSA